MAKKSTEVVVTLKMSPADYLAMLDILGASKNADGIDRRLKIRAEDLLAMLKSGG